MTMLVNGKMSFVARNSVLINFFITFLTEQIEIFQLRILQRERERNLDIDRQADGQNDSEKEGDRVGCLGQLFLNI